jgi:predicted transcriptional regulator
MKGENPMGATTTSLRLPDDLREVYDTLVAATGRSRNDLMVEALRLVGERRLHEIALIQEGRRQIRAGQGIRFEDLVTELIANGMLPNETDQDGNADQVLA